MFQKKFHLNYLKCEKKKFSRNLRSSRKMTYLFFIKKKYFSNDMWEILIKASQSSFSPHLSNYPNLPIVFLNECSYCVANSFLLYNPRIKILWNFGLKILTQLIHLIPVLNKGNFYTLTFKDIH
jgi:hypothetical protein